MRVVALEKLHDDVEAFSRGSAHSAGYDVRAFFHHVDAVRVHAHDGRIEERWLEYEQEQGQPLVRLAPGEVALIPLGFKARLAWDTEAQVRPRSGLAFKRGLVVHNAPGTIDADYPGEWMVMLRNASPVEQVIEHRERVAQVVFAHYETCHFTQGDVAVSTDRIGGFGSTGSR